METLVVRTLELSEPKHPGGHRPPLQLEQIKREIASTDREIDDLTYDLYGITPENRKIVEHT
jgi:hypothetical protein